MTINVNKPEDYIRPYELTETQSKSTSCHYQMFFQKKNNKENFPPGGPWSSGRSSKQWKKDSCDFRKSVLK
jgi:hypothetical protein